MGAGFVITLVSFAAVAFFVTIIGVFGILPALAALFLFAALACVLTVRRYEGAMETQSRIEHRRAMHITHEEVS